MNKIVIKLYIDTLIFQLIRPYRVVCRTKGGPGRRVLHAVFPVSGLSHIVSAWELGRRGPLRIVAYDPTTSMSYEVHLSTAERTCLGYHGENYTSWCKELSQRLSLRKAHSEASSARDVENQGDTPPQAKRNMVLDKTIVSTACRVAARGVETRILRVRASLVDAGGRLALDLYQDHTSKQCRFLLTAEELVGTVLTRYSDESEERKEVVLGTVIDNLHPQSEQHSPGGSCADARHVMATMLASPRCREYAIRWLTQRLCYCDEDIMSLLVNDEARTALLTRPDNTDLRRPQTRLRVHSWRSTCHKGIHSGGRCGFDGNFLNQRRQPDVLLHGEVTTRAQNRRNHDADKKKMKSASRWASLFKVMADRYAARTDVSTSLIGHHVPNNVQTPPTKEMFIINREKT